MIISTIGQTADTLADIAIKNRLQIGMIFSVIKRMGSQVYNSHIISLGAGVQSSTMALMAAHGEITPMPKFAVFADTQCEPSEVYEWLVTLGELLPFPIYQVTRSNLAEHILEWGPLVRDIFKIFVDI